ncbi:hypothetical protein AAW12_18995 [Sphingobacterium sp. Ag1]|uniref:hypothetical protein n=1 Tax=Sphingobacterium sp. Ag1 TaxID=1643451 RepID=UPI00062793E0|nr:hypothetical protein [Sphingobacterium sp. Ag1]KKO89690.1 hypothetical protein AAW12_18995 [Sphingobacterium sp. Ag1]
MKQSEKLDLILKTLYNSRSNEEYSDLTETIDKSGITTVGEIENDTLISRLITDKLVEGNLFEEGGGFIKITSRGIDYVEEDSYSLKGSPITNNNYYNTNISNSSGGVSVVNSSNNVHVNISNIGDIRNKIEDLVKAIQVSSIIAEEQKTEMIECIDEIRTSLDRNKKPKYAFDALLAMANNFAGISTLAIEVGKLIFDVK